MIRTLMEFRKNVEENQEHLAWRLEKISNLLEIKGQNQSKDDS